MSIFRELFVEVPIALLEARVRRASVKLPPATPVFAAHVDYTHAVKLVAENMLPTGWTMIETIRDQMTDVTHLAVRMDCGHRGVFTFEEMVLLLKPTEEIVDYIAERFERGPARKCKCIHYQEPCKGCLLCTCTAGVCK